MGLDVKIVHMYSKKYIYKVKYMQVFGNSLYNRQFQVIVLAILSDSVALVLKIHPYPVNRQLILSIIWLLKLTGAESDTTCLL